MTTQTKSSIIYLAGGCFWGMEELFKKQTAILDTEVGYMGGSSDSAHYKAVSSGATGHAETLKITFEDSDLTIAKIIEFFFKIHDPTTSNRQGNDVGSQYRSAIFYTCKRQQQIFNTVREKVENSGVWNNPIVTEVNSAADWQFTAAESEHQNYLQRYPEGYTCHFIRNISFD